MSLAKTPEPPYYAVIFTSVRTDADPEGYGLMASEMVALAALQPGFLGVESARSEIGITVSYWRDEASIKSWKTNVDHLAAQQLGREKWYDAFRVRVARVEREYGFSRVEGSETG